MSEGAFDLSRLNQRIVESWYRSRTADVNPYLEKGKQILTDEFFLAQKEKNFLLMNSAGPHLSKIGQFARDMGMMALVIDPEGYVLSIKGREDVLNQAKEINFVEGVRWSEGEVGTNAIGTALQAEEAILVTGTEHYSIASHQWSCAAAPIRDQSGKLLGVLDLSCPVERAHPYMLGMVVSAAYIIEQEISLCLRNFDKELINQTIDFMESIQPLLICNTAGDVVGASKPIRLQVPNWSCMKEGHFPAYGYHSQLRIPVFSKTNGFLLGYCIHLNNDKGKNADSVYVSKRKEFEFKGEAGVSLSFQRTLDELKPVAPTDASVYILGETGTGKEVIAQSIHENSPRKNGPFIAVNCGAIPKELMESELFGYVEGAFTGARRQGYKGKFEQANRGTLFLDEIGEIPPPMQVALLRVLQERKVTPIGSHKEIPLDIRIITATHRDLRQLVNEGKFREDLFYRLHVYPIYVPPLRERKEDIPHIIQFFCEKNQWDMTFAPEVIDWLHTYHWPGNIRELLNVLERLYILSQGEMKEPSQVLQWLASQNRVEPALAVTTTKEIPESAADPAAALSAREKIQKELMIDALQKSKGNVTLAAKLLGMPRSTFYKKIQKFQL
ncbi:sigma-54-dependent Fis family transcriptional regulator [Ammoniphilus sp. 3BR4]|uniref:sigma-54-dependent Fis family transcriptional regulator n=1 Tax=Ammoniphilus sp. 3BR4 TaxID=3158265 RepID=UPI003467B1C9